MDLVLIRELKLDAERQIQQVIADFIRLKQETTKSLAKG